MIVNLRRKFDVAVHIIGNKTVHPLGIIASESIVIEIRRNKVNPIV